MPVSSLLLKTQYAREVTTYAAAKMCDAEVQGGELVEQATVDAPHRRHHQGEFSAEHPSQVVRIHVRPADHLRWGVDEDKESEVGSRPPKWA